MPDPSQLASMLVRRTFKDHWNIDVEPSDDAHGWLDEDGMPAGISLDQLRHVMWHTDVTASYIDAIDQFWSEHEDSYLTLAKIGFVQAAMFQHKENSLSDDGSMLAAGLLGAAPGIPLQALTLAHLRANRSPDPMLEGGLLGIGGYHAVDLLYATDRIRRKTVLYIPGNSSPLHEFDAPYSMKEWLAEQARDVVKRDVLSTHFQLADRPDGWFHAGLDETLKGLGAWPTPHTLAGPWNDWGHDCSMDSFDPRSTISTVAQMDPFCTLSRRQKMRTYADAKTHIVAEDDVTQSRIFNIASAVAVYGMALAPLALLRPELAIPESALRTQVAKTHGSARIAFGALNATSSDRIDRPGKAVAMK